MEMRPIKWAASNGGEAVKKLHDPCPNVRLEALLQAVAEIQKPPLMMAEKLEMALEITKKCLGDPKEKVRKAAAHSLRKAMVYLHIDSQILVCSMFVEALDSPDPEVKRSAVLGLKKALARADKEVRLVTALKLMQKLSSCPQCLARTLGKIIKKKDLPVRTLAGSCLKEVGRPAADPKPGGEPCEKRDPHEVVGALRPPCRPCANTRGTGTTQLRPASG